MQTDAQMKRFEHTIAAFRSICFQGRASYVQTLPLYFDWLSVFTLKLEEHAQKGVWFNFRMGTEGREQALWKIN